jgi:DNA-binding Lrp family transcriptional regulator
MVEVIENTKGYPLMKSDEYSSVLLAEQKLNYMDINKFSDVTPKEFNNEDRMNRILAEILQQPIMAGVYRKNGIKPNEVYDYIGSVQMSSIEDKKDILKQVWIAYAHAAHNNDRAEGDKFNGLKIENSECNELEKRLSDPISKLTKSMKQFKAEQAKEITREIPTSSFGKKIVDWFKKNEKNAKTIAVGVVTAVVLTPAAQKLMQLTAKDDFSKITKTEQKTQQQNNQNMSRIYTDISKHILS